MRNLIDILVLGIGERKALEIRRGITDINKEKEKRRGNW